MEMYLHWSVVFYLLSGDSTLWFIVIDVLSLFFILHMLLLSRGYVTLVTP